METFQRPLSAGEECKYLTLLKGEDSSKAKEAKQVLIERNLRLVAHIAKKYQNVDADMDDLISIGTVGLIKAVDTYDRTKGSRLVTYAARCIDNELLMMLRMKKRSSREVSLYEPIGTDKEGNEITILDVVEMDQEDILAKIQRQEQIASLRNYLEACLNGREREIVMLRFGLGGQPELTQREIGRRFGISRSYVSRIEKRALLKLKSEFIRQEI